MFVFFFIQLFFWCFVDLVCFGFVLTSSPCLFSEITAAAVAAPGGAVQDVQNHAESPEFYQYSHLRFSAHTPALRIQIFPDQKWQTSLKTFI